MSALRDLARHALATRVLLVAAFVAASHQYEWRWLRVLTTDTLVTISALLSVPVARTGVDTIFAAGIAAKFVVSCTLIDAFAGAVPLLWRVSATWQENFLRLSAVFAGVFALNIVRLEGGFVAMHYGAPWWLAHECVSGVTYFLLLMFIVRERAWEHGADYSSPSPPSQSPVSFSF